MKKWIAVFLTGFLLTGCGARDTFESVSDELITPVMATPRQVHIDLPDEAQAAAFPSDSGTLFICDDYEIAIETLSSGDLDATLKTMTGQGQEHLSLMTTKQGECTRYDFVWAGVNDDGDFSGRGTILDDGVYHYCLSLVRPLEKMNNSQVVWRQVFNSFTVL